MKILVIQLRRVGDILLTTPAVAYLKKVFPDAQIDFLSEPMGAAPLKNNPDLHRHWIYDSAHSLREIGAVRREGYDVVFDFMNNPRSVMLAAFSGAPDVVGFRHGLRSRLYKLAVPGLTAADYVAKRKIDVIQYWLKSKGRPVPPVDSYRPKLALTQEEQDAAARWLRDVGIKSDTVVLAPGHRHPIRTWTASGFRDLALKLAREQRVSVLMAWGPGEMGFVSQIRDGVESELGLFPETSLRQMAALFQRAKLVVAPSSGAMHLAVAVGTPTVTLYGAVRPIDWEPPVAAGEIPINIALTADGVPCLGCHLNDGCPNEHRCMTELSVDRVWNACKTFLSGGVHVRSA